MAIQKKKTVEKKSSDAKGTDVKIIVVKGKVLGVDVYRGFAKLSDLARVSKADIYDQKDNPTGTQRDLYPKHAREAYEYVQSRDFAYWSEVLLCVRNKKAVSFSPSSIEDVGTLTISGSVIANSHSIAISRVDGNHRLHFASGSEKDFPPLDKIVSFCLAYDLSPEEEVTLFRDINNNQRAMNTSHLDNIEARLSTEDKLKTQNPEIYIAKKLGDEKDSPLFQRVYDGGIKHSGQVIPLRGLDRGVGYILSRSTKLSVLKDADAQYVVIKNYFTALRKWQPEAWDEPKKYILLRGAGLWAVCFIGAEVIDRVLAKSEFDVASMHKVLTSGTKWNWSNKGDFQGFSGVGGAQQISNKVTAEFEDESGVSVKTLYKQIMSK